MFSLLQTDLQHLTNPEKAVIYASFFKTGKGEYGESDQFLGLTVPQQRILAKKYITPSLEEIHSLLQSPIHEYRLTALLILVLQYHKAVPQDKEKIVQFYLAHTKQINNWDLVDTSADKILGHYLLDKDKTVLFKLAHSSNLWERRIAIVATFAFIKQNQFQETIHIAELLLHDSHDLIHKAVGWMLREVGKRDKVTLETFLQKHATKMPRTMLRYAIEKFPEPKRKYYLQKKAI
ncbi:TPA: DNA alkylation repair protein [Candidatus Woesearchaeota archaeon]|nr:DNA alkylation repair protein [Candidatus Woesearchaeota archaeon]